MSTDKQIVRIKEFIPTSVQGVEEIRVKVPVAAEGDIDIFSGTDETEVKMVLTQAVFPDYKFKSQGICVYEIVNNAGDCDTISATNLPQFPEGWSASVSRDKKTLTLEIPTFPANQEYKYKLFLNKASFAGPLDIVVDPRIKNDGSSNLDWAGSSSMPWKSPADFSGELLLFLAFMLFVVGIMTGRAWARSE